MVAIKNVAFKIVENQIFKTFIFSLILLSAILIGIETYPGIANKFRDTLVFLDQIIIYCFTLEILLKIISFGNLPLRFFKDPWNIFDFIIVVICLIPSIDTHFVAVLRIIRVLRILRMITFLPKLRLLIGALFKSIPSMGYVVLLLVILFYIYAVMGVFLYGKTDPTHFGDLHHGMVSLFKILTLEGWTDILNIQMLKQNQDGKDVIVSIWPFFYFASFILIGAMIIMNLFIGVIMNSMAESHDEMEQTMQEIKFKNKSSDELYVHIIAQLDELKHEITSLKKVMKV